ncbi:MAG: RsbRD N-terminal domain-containing protein [Desulfobacterales bacterium]
MRLEALLEKDKSAIVHEWFDMAVDMYPAEGAQFLKQQNEAFANPVGHATRKGLAALFQALLDDMNREALASVLDPIIRIRAIQAFTPSQATGFILFLKAVIRKKMENHRGDWQLLEELLRFESKIDTLNAIAFDVYMSCREKLYEIKANEEKSSTFSAFKRAGLVDDGENP